MLDCRGGSKGSIARMVTLLSGIEAMHLLLASQLPDTPGGLTSMLKFINAQTEVCIPLLQVLTNSYVLILLLLSFEFCDPSNIFSNVLIEYFDLRKVLTEFSFDKE